MNGFIAMMARGRGWVVVGAAALSMALTVLSAGAGRAATVPAGKVAFVGADGIYVQRMDGSAAERIWKPPANGTVDEPRWSPDGSRLAFDGPDGNIWTLNADGSNARALTNQAVASSGCGEDGCTTPGTRADSPRWSPDGRRVSYRLADALAHASIWTIDTAPGAVAQQVVAVEDLCIFNEGWSPAGAPLFSRCAGRDGPSNASYLSAADGGRKPFVAGSQLAYSPDGTRLAFSNQSYTSGSISVSLFVTAADGSGAQVVAAGGQEPRWSASGLLAYQVAASDGPVIHVYDPASGSDTTLGPGSLGGWTPDGWLYFTRQDGTTTTIWCERPDGTGAVQVATGGSPDWA